MTPRDRKRRLEEPRLCRDVVAADVHDAGHSPPYAAPDTCQHFSRYSPRFRAFRESGLFWQLNGGGEQRDEG